VQPARGTRDFLPADVRRREHVIRVVRDVYERYGFEPLETPAFENIDTLLGKYGDEGNKLIFKILRRGEHESSGEADLALRYDLTVPLARVVAQYQNELPKFFKRYQIQPVWRADRPARGRFREFYQCDIDSIGSTSPIVEVEQMAAVSEVLRTLGFSDFRIRLNDRRLLAALLEVAGIPADKTNEALVELDKRDKIGNEGVVSGLVARGIPADSAQRFVQVLTPHEEIAGPQGTGNSGANKWIVEHLQRRLTETVLPHAAGSQALDSLKTLLELTDASSARDFVVIDPSLARGLSYYTGAIMEIAVRDLAGSLGGGGRYDTLVGMFLGRDVPACGFSLGLERIIVVMSERGMFPESVAGAGVDVMVTLWNDSSRADALTLASELRQAGLRVDVYPDADKLGKQFKYASASRAGFVAIVGDDERAQNLVAIKDLKSGEQHSVPRPEAGAWISRRLRAENA
jgi:histidyl-tRNA synthetase